MGFRASSNQPWRNRERGWFAVEAGEDSGRSWLAGLLLVLATVLVYSATFDSGFIWDDDDYVYQNPLLGSLDGLWRIWTSGETPQYYPLVFTTYWLEYRLWGLAAGGYHIVNVLLHAVNAVLVWRVLGRLRFAGAYAVALIFALHPVHVESVAWITERKNVLSGLFFLLSVWSYFRFESSGRGTHYVAALVLFLLGLLSKTVICTLPVTLLLLCWWRRGGITPRDVLRLAPFFVLGVAMGIVTALYEHHNVLHGAEAAHWELPLADRVLVAGRAVWFYTGKLLWPHPLVFNYPRWTIDTSALTQWMWPIAAAIIAVGVCVAWKRLGRGLAVAAWYTAVSLSPALGFVNVAPLRFSFVADHFQYLASLGVITAVVGVIHAVAERVSRAAPNATSLRGYPPHVLVTMFVAAAVLGAVTYHQTLIYKNVETLWRHTIEHHPASWLARGNLGLLLRERGELDEAQVQFEYMLDHCVAWSEPLAQAHTNLGHIQMRRGALDRAAYEYEQALLAMPNKHEARFGLASAHAARGNHAGAEETYRRYLTDNPDDARAHANLALSLEALSRDAEAENHFQMATRLDATLVLPHVRWAELCRRQGRTAEAIGHLGDALAMDPSSDAVRTSLAQLLTSNDRREEAIRILTEGLLVNPDSDRLRKALAALK